MIWLAENHPDTLPDDVLNTLQLRSDPYRPFEEDPPLEIEPNESESNVPRDKSTHETVGNVILDPPSSRASCDNMNPVDSSPEPTATPQDNPTDTPNSSGSRSGTSRKPLSPITEFLTLPNLSSTPQSSKQKQSSGPRVLTSAIVMMEEKQRKKKEEEEANEQRKREREAKKLQKEEEKQKKSEDHKRKEAERKKKAEERELEKKRKAELREAERIRRAELKKLRKRTIRAIGRSRQTTTMMGFREERSVVTNVPLVLACMTTI